MIGSNSFESLTQGFYVIRYVFNSVVSGVGHTFVSIIYFCIIAAAVSTIIGLGVKYANANSRSKKLQSANSRLYSENSRLYSENSRLKEMRK